MDTIAFRWMDNCPFNTMAYLCHRNGLNNNDYGEQICGMPYKLRKMKHIDIRDSEQFYKLLRLSLGLTQEFPVDVDAYGWLRFLLLDEISSSLDEPTEYELYRRLFKIYPQKTMLFITHRKAVSELCDEVVSL